MDEYTLSPKIVFPSLGKFCQWRMRFFDFQLFTWSCRADISCSLALLPKQD